MLFCSKTTDIIAMLNLAILEIQTYFNVFQLIQKYEKTFYFLTCTKKNLSLKFKIRIYQC